MESMLCLDLTKDELNSLHWLLSDPFGSSSVSSESSFTPASPFAPYQIQLELELGPRASFSSAFSTNAVNICRAAGITSISRIERSRRFHVLLRATNCTSISGSLSDCELDELRQCLSAPLHDRMTECLYSRQLESLSPPINRETRCRVEVLPVIEEGVTNSGYFNT